MTIKSSRIPVIIWIWITFLTGIWGQEGYLHTDTLPGEIHNTSIPYTVYRPDIPGLQPPLKTMLLLHGLNGDHQSFLAQGLKSRLDSLIRHKLIEPVMVIMPHGYNSYFINSYDGKLLWEDKFINTFLPHIKEQYPHDTNHIYLGGYSMGGYGAINLLMKYPEWFQGCLAVSAAIRTDQELLDMHETEYDYKYAKVFGSRENKQDRLSRHWKQNNFFHQIESVNPQLLKDKKWFISCGDDDLLSHGNALLHNKLMEYQIPHEFRTYDGGHGWDYFFPSFDEGMIRFFKPAP